MRTVNLYAGGGAGINIARELYRPEPVAEPGFAAIRTVFIDASGSNVPPEVLPNAFIRITSIDGSEIDGSGKVRSTNYKAAAAAVPQILHDHKPADLNILLHSASGGSGSAILPALASELLLRGEDILVILIGSTTCRQEIKNTINTLLSYQSISTLRERSVVCYYLENGERPMRENDATARVITLLSAALWSGENFGLDKEDLHNWLNYDRVSTYPPALTAMELDGPGVELERLSGQAVSSTVTLIREGEDPTPSEVVGYHSFGTISQAAAEAIKMPSPIHLNTVQGYFPRILTALQEKLAAIEEVHRANNINKITLEKTAIESDGMVL